MINAQNLTKYYGLNCAVDNLTFTAEKGEVLGFLGPNGAGKTTTMRILTGFMPPTSGTVKIGGFDVIEQSLEVRRLVGYLPESVPLYNDMRVADYLKFMAQLRHIKDVDARVDQVMELVDMTDRAQSFIAKLSKGMRQRVGLAQALIHQPEVLILDEPTIGLDPAQIIEIRKVIQEIGKEKTVLLSTHILSEAQQICDSVMIINHGKLIAEDSPNNLQKRLTGTRKVFIKVGEHIDRAIKIIKSFPGIELIQVNSQGQIEFENPKGQDLQSTIAKTLVTANISLLEIHTEDVNLEDIYLQLIQDESTSQLETENDSKEDLEPPIVDEESLEESETPETIKENE